MPQLDLFPTLLALGHTEKLAKAATDAIARVHRRPAGLRKFDVISSESLLRGARSSAMYLGHGFSADINYATNLETPHMEGREGREGREDGREDQDADLLQEIGGLVSAYSVLAPERMDATVRTFMRAPLQVLSRIDVALGGPGMPVAADGGARLQSLAGLIAQPVSEHVPGRDALLPLIVHSEIAAREIFGPRSEAVGRVAMRVCAVATGFDPRGFAVPEPYILRNRQNYEQALTDYLAGDVAPLLEVLLRAFNAGATEADGIAQAV